MKRFIPFVTLLLFMAGCQLLASTELTEEAAKYEKNHEIIGEEKAEIIGEIHPDIFKPALVTDKIDEGNILEDRKSTRLNSSHVAISYAVFCLKKKKT